MNKPIGVIHYIDKERVRQITNKVILTHDKSEILKYFEVYQKLRRVFKDRSIHQKTLTTINNELVRVTKNFVREYGPMEFKDIIKVAVKQRNVVNITAENLDCISEELRYMKQELAVKLNK
jgi:phosphopantothenate synthetase